MKLNQHARYYERQLFIYVSTFGVRTRTVPFFGRTVSPAKSPYIENVNKSLRTSSQQIKTRQGNVVLLVIPYSIMLCAGNTGDS